MRKILLLLTTLLMAGAAFAQDKTSLKAAYERQVRLVGADGVGVETIINKWIAADDEDPEAFNAKFIYCFSKSQGSDIIVKNAQKYLGQKPVLTLKDSLGADVNYFSVTVFVDSLYADSIKAIDKAIALRNTELRYSFQKISALLLYENENPDLAYTEIMKLIDLFYGAKGTPALKGWTLDSQEADGELFKQAVSEYCVDLFNIGSPAGYKYFKSISERMTKIYPKETVFINNLGSYWQIAEKNYKKAITFYKKSLKIDPSDYAANSNIRIIERLQKVEKKK